MFFTQVTDDFQAHKCPFKNKPIGSLTYEDEEVKVFKVFGKDYHDFSLSL